MGVKQVEVIRGDTFFATATYKDSLGAPVNLTLAGITVEAFARNPEGTAEVALTVVVAANQVIDTGKFTITSDTATWTDDGSNGLTWNVRLRYTSTLGRFSSEAVDVVLVP